MKIFRRLPAGSQSLLDAAKCGFSAYRSEQVWRMEQEPATVRRTQDLLRRRAKPDQYPLFQLYNSLVPDTLRRFEGMTMTEWTAAQESLGKTAQYVSESDGRIAGLLRLAGEGDLGRFDLLGAPDTVDDLIEVALAKLANRRVLSAIVPEYQEHVARNLEARGFAPAEEFNVLARRTVRPVMEAQKAPAIAQTTFG
jgi:hypothetical protein